MSSSPAESSNLGRDVRFVGGLFLASRALVAFIAAVAPLWFKSGAWFHGRVTDIGWKEYLRVWDVGWYGNVALEGYRFDPNGDGNVAFFPLFPLLLRTAHAAGIDVFVAGPIFSNAALVLSLWLLLRLVETETRSRPTAELSTALLAFSPAAVWFSLGLTESLFLLLTLVVATAARNARWAIVLIAGVLAGLTRPNGFLLAAPVATLVWPALAEAWRTRRWRTLGGLVAAVAGPVFGHLAFLGYLQWSFGNWRAAQIAAETRWHNGFSLTWQELSRHLPGVGLRLFDAPLPYGEHIAWSWLFVLAAGLFASIGLWEHRARAWHGVWLAMFISFHLFVFQGLTPAGPIARYAAVVPAFYVGLALLAQNRAWLGPTLLAFSATALALQTALIFCGYQIA